MTTTWAAFRLPLVELAKKHADEVHPREARGGKLQHLGIFRAGPNDLMRFGLGVGLYFQFLKAMSVVFFLMFIFTVPALYFNLSGSRVRSNSDRIPIPATTVGNLGDRTSGAISDVGMTLYGVGARISAKAAGLVISCLDAAYCLLLLLAIAALRWRQARAARRAAADAASCSDYAVQLWGLPGDAREEEVAEYLRGAFGEVQEVALARDDAPLLRLYLRRADRAAALERERALAARAEKEAPREGPPPNARALERAEKRLAAVDEAVAARRQAAESSRVVCGFAVFTERLAAARAIAEQPRPASLLQRACCGCCGPRRNPAWFRETHALRISRAPEPSDVFWENLPVGAPSRLVRRLLMVTVAVVLMIITAGTVYGAQSQASSVFPSEGRCTLLYPALADVADPATGAVTNANCAVRYCKGLTQPERLSQAALCRNQYCEELDPNALVQEPLCAPYLTDLGKLTGLQAAVVVVVTLVNLLTVSAVTWLTAFARFHTATERSVQSLWMLTVAQFVNTALIALVVNARLAGADTSNVKGVPLFYGVYTDFESAWYRSVGTSIVIAVTTSAVSNGLVSLALIPFKAVLRWWARGHATTQRELDGAYEGKEFDVPAQLAFALAVLYTCLLYSAGMPIMIVLAAILLFWLYWCEKIAFCRLYTKPPAYSMALIRRAMTLAQYAVVFHLAFAVWIYSSPDIFPSEDIVAAATALSDTARAYYDAYVAAGGALNVNRRLRQVSAVPPLVLLVLLVAAELCRLAFALLGALLPACRRLKAPAVAASTPAPFPLAKAAIEAAGPATFDIGQNPRFKAAFESLARDEHLPALAQTAASVRVFRPPPPPAAGGGTPAPGSPPPPSGPPAGMPAGATTPGAVHIDVGPASPAAPAGRAAAVAPVLEEADLEADELPAAGPPQRPKAGGPQTPPQPAQLDV